MGYLKLWSTFGSRNLPAVLQEVEGEYPSIQEARAALAQLPAFSGIEHAQWQPGGYGCPEKDRVEIEIQ